MADGDVQEHRQDPYITTTSPNTHDVFLSFRGKDTRKTFVDHLYSALKQQGIDTYKDDETLPRGESISPSLMKAIEEAQIAVIVFSKNYADSSWCLDELACIVKCKKERGQIVFPIFYDVKPSDVRKQKQKFGEAFAKQESEHSNRVEEWRKALVDAADLSGWEPKLMANGHESQCIKEIVGIISHRLHLLSVSEDLVGIETRKQDLISQLEIGSGGVRMVGIWGVGGGGKSTLAFSVYNEISREFDGCCLVENVREESSKYDLKKLQEKILLDVLKQKEMSVRSTEEGRCMIKSRLRHKKVLIVLDDVDQLDHLKALAGSHNWFGEGSRIIITTRDNHLLHAHKVNAIYNISLLNDDEAIQLFRWHAPQESRPIEDYETLSLHVVSYAGGLPLALKVLGSFLCDKDMSEWRSAFARLKDIPDTDIVEKLKISYDGLKPMEKELFLDIACFWRGNPKDDVMMTLDACGFHPVIGVKVLIQKALVTISNGRFDMHDLIQEMGHYIIRGEQPNNPENHSRVWLEEDVLNICTEHATTENDKIEALKYFSFFDSLPCLPQAVANMKKLRLLDVDQFYYDEPEFPQFLSNELRWLTWSCYPAISLPANFQPTKLRCLILKHSLLEQLWNGCKRLPNLKVLNLKGSHLIRTPDFGGLPNLERLILSSCKDLEDIHPSIGHLGMLVYLDLEACDNLKMFPPIVKMKKLETLKLSFCSQLRKFPEIQENMDSLEHLYLQRCGIEIVPSSIGQYCTNLISLDLTHCHNLKSIEGNFRFLKCLKELHGHGCTRFVKLPKDLFDIECCIEELSLPPMRHSPSSEQFSHIGLVGSELPHLPRFLRKLKLKGCNLVDGDIPFDICELSNLEVLDLSFNNFSRLHSSLSQLSRLKFLNLSSCDSLVELPKLPSSLVVLRADRCNSLETVGNIPISCKWLWKVTLWGANEVIGGERLLQSMLQGNAIENHFLSLKLGGHEIPKGLVPSLVKRNMFTLQLPQNWYNDFSGFLMCITTIAGVCNPYIEITMKEDLDDLMGMNSHSELCKASKSLKRLMDDVSLPVTPLTYMGYVSFGSLRHTTWWNSTYSMISFSFKGYGIPKSGFGVGLVPRKCKGDPMDTTKGATDCSEFWDEKGEDQKTFWVEHDSESSIKLTWHPNF